MDFLMGLATGLAVSVAFYPVFVGAFLWLWYSSENCLGFPSIFLTLLIGVLVFAKWPELSLDNWQTSTIVYAMVGYLLVGILWAISKWVIYLRRARNKFIACKHVFLRENQLPENYFTDSIGDPNFPIMCEEFVKRLSHRYNSVFSHYELGEAIKRIIPQASANKTEIVMSGAYWPLSLIWFVISDFVIEVAGYVYDKLSGGFQRISNHMFKDVL